MRGAKPIPFHLKVLRGNPSHRRLRPEVEPAQPETPPEPPEFLMPEGKAEWRRIISELHALRLVTALDVQLFAVYCQMFARWHAAETALRRMAENDTVTAGLLIKTPDGPRRNPLLKVANDAGNAMLEFGSEFGLTAIARTRLAAGTEWRSDTNSKLEGLLA
jgi:P27 family predicted phage terminase small subunit